MDPVAVPAARAESTILRVKMPLGSKSYLRPRSTCATRSWAATARIRLNCCDFHTSACTRLIKAIVSCRFYLRPLRASVLSALHSSCA